MRRIHRTSTWATLLWLVALLLGAASAKDAASSNLDLALCAPDQNSFTFAIDNTYFPFDSWRISS
jgi:hypothetical protein